MWIVRKAMRFEAAHSLPHLPEGHKCRNPHGHSYRVVFVCQGPLTAEGWVVDYADIVAAAAGTIADLDHQDLNQIVSGPTTAENLAYWIYGRVAFRLPSLVAVEVEETATASVIYQP